MTQKNQNQKLESRRVKKLLQPTEINLILDYWKNNLNNKLNEILNTLEIQLNNPLEEIIKDLIIKTKINQQEITRANPSKFYFNKGYIEALNDILQILSVLTQD